MTAQHHMHGICFVLHKQFLASLYITLGQAGQPLSGIAGPKTPRLPEEAYMHLFRTPVHAFGVHVFMRFFRRETQAPLYVSRLRHHFERTSPDVIIAFDIYHWYTLQCLAYKRKHPETCFVIWSESRSMPRNLLSRLAFRLFLSALRMQRGLIDIVFVYSEEGRKFMQALLPGVSVMIMPAPVDTHTFYPDTDAHFMPDGTLRVLMNARFVAYKRHRDMLRALKILRLKGIITHVSLIGHEGHLKEQIRKEAEALGVADSITFLTSVPHERMREIYRMHDVLVLPSRNEAIGMAVPEAMACGIPTVTSDTVGANIYVEDGMTGFIYATGNVDALATSLERLANRDTLVRFGAVARERIEESFSASRVSARFTAALDLS